MGCVTKVTMNASRNITTMPQEQLLTMSIAGILNAYIMPAIVVVGLVGNTVSCMVFASKELRKLSSSVYVLAVLISDSGTLVCLSFVWLEVLGYRINHMHGICQFVVYLTYVCSFLSVWYMVCITVENFITICHPLKVKVMCTKNRASVVVIVLAVAAMLLYIITFVATEVRTVGGMSFCQSKPRFGFLLSMFTYVDSIVTLLVPVTSIAFMLIGMGFSIAHTVRWRRNSPRTDSTRRCIKSPQFRVTKMLFALSTAFIIMNAPLHIMRLFYLLRASTGGHTGVSFTSALVHLFLLFSSYLHCAIKFFLFMMFSKNFRRCIRAMLCSFAPNCSKDINNTSQAYV